MAGADQARTRGPADKCDVDVNLWQFVLVAILPKNPLPFAMATSTKSIKPADVCMTTLLRSKSGNGPGTAATTPLSSVSSKHTARGDQEWCFRHSYGTPF